MEKLDELRSLAMRHAGTQHSGLSRLAVHSATEPTELNASVYQPTACIVIQGAQRTVIGDKVFSTVRGRP